VFEINCQLPLHIQVFAEAQLRLKQQLSDECKNFSPLIVGNPLLAGKYSKLPNLLSAAKEVEEIGKLLGVQPIIGKEATCSYITSKMPTSKIVHLATHGILDEKKSSNAYIPGALVLGDDEGIYSFHCYVFGEITSYTETGKHTV